MIKTAHTKLQFPRHDLEALRTLGNGSYGNVFLAKASEIVEGEGTSIVVVQSLTSKDEEVKKEFMKTMEKLSLKHKNIGKLLGVCQEEDPMYLISEYPEQVNHTVSMYQKSQPSHNTPPPTPPIPLLTHIPHLPISPTSPHISPTHLPTHQCEFYFTLGRLVQVGFF